MSKNLLFSIALLPVLGTICLCGFDPTRLFPETEWERMPPAISQRTIDPTYADRIIWRKDDLLIRRRLAFHNLIATADEIALVNFVGGPVSQSSRLELFEAETGELLWASAGFLNHDDFTRIDGTAFVVAQSRDGKMVLDIYKLMGDARPQRLLVDDTGLRPTFKLTPASKEEVFLYYTRDGEANISTINKMGNRTKQPIAIPTTTVEDFSLLLLEEENFFIMQVSQAYLGGNYQTGEILWRIPRTDAVIFPPVLSEGRLFITESSGDVVYAIKAIDKSSGTILWETEKLFGSNITLHNEALYALRNDAVLVKLDILTGNVVEEIAFYPNNVKAGFHHYEVASNGENLFVYFGDSQELFALNPP